MQGCMPSWHAQDNYIFIFAFNIITGTKMGLT